MRLLIVGANRLGRVLAADLEQHKHDVRVVDARAKRLAALPEALRQRTVHGSPLDRDTLERALAGCDALIALTRDDALNTVVAFAARRELHVPLAIAVVANPARAAALTGLGVHVVCPTTRTARELRHAVARSGVESELPIDAEVAVYRAELPARITGRTVSELERPGELRAIALERDGRVLLAVPRLAVAAGDVLHVAATDRNHVVDLTRP